MTNTFKKSLIALAVAGFATSAMAAEVKPAPGFSVSNLSAEGLQSSAAADNFQVDGFDVVLGARYRQNDVAEFNYSGAAVRTSTISANLAELEVFNGGFNLQTGAGESIEGAVLAGSAINVLFGAGTVSETSEYLAFINDTAVNVTGVSPADFLAGVEFVELPLSASKLVELTDDGLVSVGAEDLLTVADVLIEVLPTFDSNDLLDTVATTFAADGDFATGVFTNGLEFLNESQSGTDTTVRYRVTSGPQLEIGSVVRVPAASVDFINRTASSSVAVNYTAISEAGQPLDTVTPQGATRTIQLARVLNQFDGFREGAEGALDKTIDVSEARLRFTSAGNGGRDGVSADFTIEPEQYNVGTAANPLMTYGGFLTEATDFSINHELTGDFGWLLSEDTDGETVVNTDILGASCNGGTLSNLEVTPMMASFDCAYTYNNSVATQLPTGSVSFDVSEKDVVIPTQSFALTSVVSYGSNQSKTFTADAGEWVLNGSEVLVPYLPFAEGFSQVLVVTNDSAQTGDITVEAIDESGEVYPLGVVGEIGPYQTARITPAVVAALAEYGITNAAPTNRVALRIITNAPNDKVTIHSAYRRGSETTEIIVNSSNGK